MLEKAHRYCIKYMQSLPSRTRADVALSLIAFNPIIAGIDYRKLVFLGQLSSLSIHCITKELFIHRVINYIAHPRNKMGFIPYILQILDKYSLRHIIDNFIESVVFMSIPSWKRLVRSKINDHVKVEWYTRMTSDTAMNRFLRIHNEYEPSLLWKFSKEIPNSSQGCQNCITFIGMLFSNYKFMFCAACGMLYNNEAEHTILYCRVTERINYQLWHRLICEFGFEEVSQLIHSVLTICTQTGTCGTRSGDLFFFSVAFDEISVFTKN